MCPITDGRVEAVQVLKDSEVAEHTRARHLTEFAECVAGQSFEDSSTVEDDRLGSCHADHRIEVGQVLL
jgi:hypothetical protein